MVNIRRANIADEFSQTVNVGDTPMPNHYAFSEQEEGEFTLAHGFWRRNCSGGAFVEFTELSSHEILRKSIHRFSSKLVL
jgi:hypothetical protein